MRFSRRSMEVSTLLLCCLLALCGCASRTNRVKPVPTQVLHKLPNTHKPTELDRFMAESRSAPLPLRLLVLGLDASQQRSDVILAVTIPEKGAINVVSIPRDTRVLLPEHKYGKINQIYAHGGAQAVSAVVQRLLGHEYPHYVTLSFTGMERLVDALGGVPVDVEENMRYTDKAGGLYIDIKQGKHVLAGKQALQYVRYRADGRGDIGRIGRQQAFMSAWAHAVIAQPQRLLALRAGLPKGVTTDMRWSEALRLAVELAVGKRPLRFTMLPGKAAYVSNVSYWLPHPSGYVGQPVQYQAGAAP